MKYTKHRRSRTSKRNTRNRNTRKNIRKRSRKNRNRRAIGGGFIDDVRERLSDAISKLGPIKLEPEPDIWPEPEPEPEPSATSFSDRFNRPISSKRRKELKDNIINKRTGFVLDPKQEALLIRILDEPPSP